MPHEITRKIGNHTYIYLSHSYRNENGKPRNKRDIIGKILPNGQKIYKPQYIEQMRQNNTPITLPTNQPQFSINDIKNATTQEHGLTNLLQKTADNIGLTEALKTALPQHHKQIHNIATYLIATGDPFMYCQEWLNNTTASNTNNLTSQHISELLNNITYGDRETFYQEWCKKRTEQEYLALDITSTSTYSNLIEDAEWGYNRDNEKLPQINLCMLMGQTSHLPIYQTTYSGSLSDVSTLHTTLAKFDAIAGDKSVVLIMDKGFFSKKNVDMLFTQGKKFLMAVPFTVSLAREQVEAVRGSIDCFENMVLMGGESVRGVTRRVLWGEGFGEVFVHVFFNPLRAVVDREKFYVDVARMREEVLRDPVKFVDDELYQRFFVFERVVGGGFSVVFREGVFEGVCRFAGFLVLVSNYVLDAGEALRVYRDKDVVEKGFECLKNVLGLGRLRAHSDSVVVNKFFVGFVALVLLSYVHSVMFKAGLYKKYTLKQLLRVLSRFRVHSVKGVRIKVTPTKEVREIYTAFGFTDDL